MVKINIVIEGEVNDAIISLKQLVKYQTKTKTYNINNSDIIDSHIIEPLNKVSKQAPITKWNRKFVKEIINSMNEQNTSIYNEINSSVLTGITTDNLINKLNILPLAAYRFLAAQTHIVNKINKNSNIFLSKPVTYDKKENKFYINTLFSDLYNSIYIKTKIHNDQIKQTIDKNNIQYTQWNHNTIVKLISSLNINNQIILHELKSIPNHQISIEKLCENLSITPIDARVFHISIRTVTKRLNNENKIVLVPVIDYDRRNKIITMHKDFAKKFYDK